MSHVRESIMALDNVLAETCDYNKVDYSEATLFPEKSLKTRYTWHYTWALDRHNQETTPFSEWLQRNDAILSTLVSCFRVLKRAGNTFKELDDPPQIIERIKALVGSLKKFFEQQCCRLVQTAETRWRENDGGLLSKIGTGCRRLNNYLQKTHTTQPCRVTQRLKKIKRPRP